MDLLPETVGNSRLLAMPGSTQIDNAETASNESQLNQSHFAEFLEGLDDRPREIMKLGRANNFVYEQTAKKQNGKIFRGSSGERLRQIIESDPKLRNAWDTAKRALEVQEDPAKFSAAIKRLPARFVIS